MSLRDRQYMKRWGKDDPYHNQLELGPPGSKRIVASGVRHRPRWWAWLLLVVAVVAIVAFGYPHRRAVADDLRKLRKQSGEQTMRLNDRPGLDSPATVNSTWSVDDPAGDRVTVTVPAGSVPRPLLVAALAQHGYRVVGG
ncbi:MAG TPA: hypothetical protein VH063_13495 [Gaiellaceae bacterium]|jgi:hypothetical protein|nr:hypothetical protein [Gaiellaceae bacterium]